MIFNRNLLIVLAGFQGLSEAATLRSRSLESEGQPLETEYDLLVSVLNKAYGDTCQAHVAGTDEEPVTFVYCTRPGGKAYLIAEGDPSTGSPVPKIFQVCSDGSEMKEKCETYKFTGKEEKDLKKVSKLLHGRDRDLVTVTDPMIVGTDFDMLEELLNGAYKNKCSHFVTGELPAEPITYVVCSHPGSKAYLRAKGATNPVPTKLQVCSEGTEMKECETVDLTGDTTMDLPAARKALGMKN
jgi:hypothetical protein